MGIVFVCYAREDLPVVDLMVRKLEERGIVVWFGNRDIRYGENIHGQIRTAIRSSSAFLYCASEATVKRMAGTLFAMEEREALTRIKSDPSFRVLCVKAGSDEGSKIPEHFGGRALTNFSRSGDWPEKLSQLADDIRSALTS